ncbi:MFS transporter [Luteipulveratus mongoliensis]|nr:MFS transporter [Luteipulveratus mongoliensis]
MRGWAIVIAYGLMSAMVQVLWLTYAAFTSDAAVHFGVSESAVVWLANVLPLLYIVLGLPSGMLLDRWFRSTLALAGGLTALGACVRLFDGYGPVLAGQLLIAIAQPFVLNAVSKLADAYLPREQRAAGIAVGASSGFVGMLAGLLLGGMLGVDGLTTLHVIGAVGSVAAAVLLAFLLRTPPADGVSETRVTLASLRALVALPSMKLIGSAVFFAFGLFIALTATMEVLLKPHGVDTDSVGLILAAMVVAGIVGSAIIPTRVARLNTQRPVLIATMTIAALGCLALAIAPGELTAWLVAIIVGFPLLASLPIVLELTEQIVGEAGGSTGAAYIYIIGNAGGIVLSLIVDPALDHAAIAFAIFALAAAAAAVIASRLPRTVKAEPVLSA